MIYAIGEIVLVVIGILIALQVNNLNEKRKLDKKTKAIFSQIIDELVIDTYTLKDMTDFYQYKDSLINVYFKTDFKDITLGDNNQIRESDLENLIRTYAPLTIHDRGFNLLMSHTDQLDDSYNDEINELLYLYEDLRNSIDNFYSGLLDMLLEHRQHMIKNHNWYSKKNIKAELSKEELNYYKYDSIYKNYVSFYDDMIRNITLPARVFQDKAIKFCNKTNNNLRLNKDLKSLTMHIPKEDLLQQIKGNYLYRNKDTLTFTIKKNQLYESTYDKVNVRLDFKNYSSAGILRQLNDSTFYRNPKQNLVINEKGELYFINSFAFEKTMLLKRIDND